MPPWAIRIAPTSAIGTTANARPAPKTASPVTQLCTALYVALPIRGPAVGLFADQEIRLLRGPLFVGDSYTTEREVVALSGSRRTESVWVRTTVFAADNTPVATMLLNLASIKDSYANYEREHKALYG